MKLKVKRDSRRPDRPWRVARLEECHDHCFRYLGTFDTWEQALRFALAMAHGD